MSPVAKLWQSPAGRLHLHKKCSGNGRPQDTKQITLTPQEARDALAAGRVCQCARYAAWRLQLTHGVRFRAFPDHAVEQGDGSVAVPVYRVTQVRGDMVYYRLDDDGGPQGMWATPVERLVANGLDVLP